MRSMLVEGRPKARGRRKLSPQTLEALLAWGVKEEQKLTALLKVLPPELPEYDMTLTALEKVQGTLGTIRRQLASRR